MLGDSTKNVDDHHHKIDSRDRDCRNKSNSNMCIDTYIGTTVLSDSDSELSDDSIDGLTEELRM